MPPSPAADPHSTRPPYHQTAPTQCPPLVFKRSRPSSPRVEFSAPLRASFHEGLLPPGGQVKLNDVVGSGISGILYKWVNYGKGWRPRWFVLQDGVLSYYKIHGPDRIEVNKETEKGSKVIGDESIRRIGRHRKHHCSHLRRKPIGEVHLKVSSIKESRSDDKRFSIFTGTKTLHLRAETREDRGSWMEALLAVKEMFPRMSNSELMAPVDGLVVSTEKLRQRLQQEGHVVNAASDEVINYLNLYVRNRIGNHLKLLQFVFLAQTREAISCSYTEKVDLENTLVDESQKQAKDDESASRSRQEKSSACFVCFYSSFVGFYAFFVTGT
ncbi:oxysterol-binding protein-related protein 1C [Dioscorea cayenensis subsp. rotundata]|uniref:Oxysterol-binding protein-related protein 1C n=1 Tax=Dioscorea cayennensis subsp. rotundata TaxID=55577 RepID=A0AB40AFU6_DIOCR|nr:oxysterol-binding protein-related protein 1C [Dioscorea cayenensis subsp. rotundata]